MEKEQPKKKKEKENKKNLPTYLDSKAPSLALSY